MKITVGELELKYSGFIIGIVKKPIKIVLTDEIEGDYTLIFNFIDDVGFIGTYTKINPVNDHMLEIRLINFTGEGLAGNTDIITLGTLEKRELFLNYRVQELSNLGKTFFYNFYLGKEVKNVNVQS